MRAVHVARIAGIGGAERHLLTLLPALAERGIEPAFVGLDVPGEAPEPFYAALGASGVPAVRLASRRDLDPALPLRLARAARGFRPDVLHTHLVHADVYGALLPGVRLVSTKHNDDPFRTGPFRHVERLLARRAARVIAITDALRRFNLERVGLPAEKLVTVHYGLDAPPEPWNGGAVPDLPGDARVLLAVARLVRQKGIDVAIRALAQVRRAEPDAVLVVLGEGPERPELERLAASLEVGGAVLLPGRVGDVAALLERAELLVHPARWEGFGLALLEAMLAGRPVVASRVSSVPELVADGETGLLLAPDDPEALAGALLRLLGDPRLAAAYGRAGRERARSAFSVARMAERTAAVYADAVQ